MIQMPWWRQAKRRMGIGLVERSIPKSSTLPRGANSPSAHRTETLVLSSSVGPQGGHQDPFSHGQPTLPKRSIDPPPHIPSGPYGEDSREPRRVRGEPGSRGARYTGQTVPSGPVTHRGPSGGSRPPPSDYMTVMSRRHPRDGPAPLSGSATANLSSGPYQTDLGGGLSHYEEPKSHRTSASSGTLPQRDFHSPPGSARSSNSHGTPSYNSGPDFNRRSAHQSHGRDSWERYLQGGEPYRGSKPYDRTSAGSEKYSPSNASR